MRGKLDLHGLEKYDPIAVRSEYTEEELEEFTFKTMCKVGRWGAWRMRLGREERGREGERVRGKEGEKRERKRMDMSSCVQCVFGEIMWHVV